jgi:hypothetical protein
MYQYLFKDIIWKNLLIVILNYEKSTNKKKKNEKNKFKKKKPCIL